MTGREMLSSIRSLWFKGLRPSNLGQSSSTKTAIDTSDEVNLFALYPVTKSIALMAFRYLDLSKPKPTRQIFDSRSLPGLLDISPLVSSIGIATALSGALTLCTTCTGVAPEKFECDFYGKATPEVQKSIRAFGTSTACFTYSLVIWIALNSQ
jgi:hypothetical protein